VSEAKRKGKEKRTKSVFREYFELIAETAVFVFFVMTFVVQAFQIPSASMVPTLQIGDFLLVNKFVYDNGSPALDKALLPRREIRRNDIIVFKYPEDLSKDYVKRVVGLPGETLEIRNKQVYIDDRPIDEPAKRHTDPHTYAKNEMSDYGNSIRDNFGPVKVPAGQYFAMGDNRDDSADSRYWGFVPAGNIKGRPWVIYFSYEAEPEAYKKTSVGERLKKLARFIPKARWNRLLKLVK